MPRMVALESSLCFDVLLESLGPTFEVSLLALSHHAIVICCCNVSKSALGRVGILLRGESRVIRSAGPKPRIVFAS